MGTVITVNKIVEMPNDFTQAVIGIEQIVIEGSPATAETKFYKIDDSNVHTVDEEIEEIEDEIDEDFVEVLEEDVLEEIDETAFSVPGGDIVNYQKFKLEHYQKYPIVGIINQKEFKEILRIFKIDVYVNDKYAISYSKHKGNVALSAFKRLSSTTQFKSKPFELDLLQVLETIINSASGITIQAGWFANLGLANLNSVLLRGEDVNEAPDWQRFKKTKGASLSNIELLIEDASFPNNKVSISLSKRGILYCKKNISPEKSLELTDRIFQIIGPSLAVAD
ncbi:hypothetical protein [Kurthia gibsonii]|uniref:hypothetical protein n=1 Tax=Kurthia gibsonii TaxID=33946 RepID=UPI002DB87C59|nr:hypothetical protein [Kurthia gibsonii]MEB7772436.1 hypothetical protein [Kurthia gibsonii]